MQEKQCDLIYKLHNSTSCHRSNELPSEKISVKSNVLDDKRMMQL